METIFRISNVADLNKKFLTTLKLLFKGQEIEISVKTYSDETEFLMKEPENSAFISKAVQDLNEKKNLVSFDSNEYNSLVNELMKK
jgi:hypothetical protein